MNELEKILPDVLADAIAKARVSGRGDIADFLALRASNDIIRHASIKWLFDSMIEVASRAQAEHPHLTIEREEPYTFRHQSAELTGSLLELRLGVRCLRIEAGWTRLPKDGFIRGGGMAFARFVHFGLPKAGVELSLRQTKDGASWSSGEGDALTVFGSADIIHHFSMLLQ